ncbi:MAG: hypothetical protein COB85_01310 [Bacteroidetes bacterium]|nr:MAG: hypothetical protein COB85_01310 [Bacteroidota bacterium]
MKRVFLFVLLLCLTATGSFAQGEGNNWYFGIYAGLNFSTNPPTILNDGHLTTSEGCAAVSNKLGVLLFYTDGSLVWDANHNIMPNGTGLFGNPSSTQSAVICPKPGTYNYSLKRFDGYFIVTIDYNAGSNGVRFSEVDMTMNGGMGDVLTANKNTLLFGTNTTEGANVARHGNGCDYWIIAKTVGSTDINTYLITSAGVNTTPIVSTAVSTGMAHVGSVKVSPNNKLVSIVNNSTPSVEVFDFDNFNGVLTSKFFHDMPWLNNYRAYSSEFSADNNLLYTATLNNPSIYQYDLTSVSNAAFQASEILIGTTANTNGYRMCALQMAPNGKIYASLQSLDYIGVINNPNVVGTGCNYVDNGQSIAGVNTFSGTNMIARLGLPAFPSFFITQPVTIVASNLCFQDQTVLQLSDTNDVDLIEWTIVDMNFNLVTQSTSFEPTIQFSDSGQYLVSAIVHYPCFIDSSVFDTIRITYINPVKLGADTLLCTGDSLIIDAGPGYDNYIWSTGDTTQTTVVNSSGQYIVQALMQSDDSVCVESDTILIITSPIPISDFTATTACFGTATAFTDISNPNGGTITNWEWDFDNDGQTDTTIQNPVYTFPSAGSFPVNLKVSSAGGFCSHDTTIIVLVNAMPASNFGLTDVCTDDAVIFSDSSTLSSGTIVSYAWDFGDAPPSGTSTQQNPTYTYSTPGTFIVILTVTSDSGCIDVQGKSIDVFPVPNASFTASNACLYDAVAFSNTSTINSGNIIGWQWDFGDLDTSLSENPSHLYDMDGTYNVSLVITSDNNCSDTISQPIIIYPVPIAIFSWTDVCLYDPAVFTESSTVSSGNIIAWYWEFDDGSTSTLQNPTYSYSADGGYDVSLIVLTDNGCVDTTLEALTIYPVPVAGVSAADECLNDPVTFTDATIINSPGSVNSWTWDFGDGFGTSNAQSPFYTYATSGTYNVILTVTSVNNCIDDTMFTVEVYPLPVAGFTADTLSGCEPLCVNFTDTTTISSGTIASWDWDFGDGNTSTAQNSQNCYSAIDESTSLITSVTLVATSSYQCSSTLTIGGMITVWPKPIGNFMAGPQPTTLLSSVIDFRDQSLGDVTSWTWDFGDSDTLFGIDSAAANPSHLYVDTGTYVVRQIISNQYACRDTAYHPITIDPASIMHVPNSFTPNGDGINEGFLPKGIGFAARKYEMRIYDRWGDLIFKTEDVNLPWYGTANNGRKVVQTDVYIWMILATNMQGEKHTSIGHVTLIR